MAAIHALPITEQPSHGVRLPAGAPREYIGAVALEDRARRDLVVTLVATEPHAGHRRRQLRANVFRGAKISERFAGVADGNVFSLTSPDGALMIGLLNDGHASGSFIFPDGAAYRFFADAVRWEA